MVTFYFWANCFLKLKEIFNSKQEEKRVKQSKSSFLKKYPGPERRSTDHVLDASRPSAVIHACVFIRGDTVSQQWGTTVLLLLLLGDLIYQSYDLERVILSSRSQLRDTLTCPSNWSVSLKRGNLDFWCVSSRKYAICKRDHCKKKGKKESTQYLTFSSKCRILWRVEGGMWSTAVAALGGRKKKWTYHDKCCFPAFTWNHQDDIDLQHCSIFLLESDTLNRCDFYYECKHIMFCIKHTAQKIYIYIYLRKKNTYQVPAV